MSGGAYDYFCDDLDRFAEALRENHSEKAHVVTLVEHLHHLAKLLHDIEWADSGDTSWNDALDVRIMAETGYINALPAHPDDLSEKPTTFSDKS